MTDNFNFFKVESSFANPEKGKILISEPFLIDSYFKRSLVFLTEYSNEGTIGFVLNKPLEIKLNEVLKGFPKIDVNVSLGGPVNTDTIHFIHTLGKLVPSSIHVIDNIYWGGDFEVIKELLAERTINNHQVRFFLGYSGWSPNQLENELHKDSWLVTSIDSNRIMDLKDDSNWKDILNGLENEKYRMWTKFPENPQHN